MCIGRYYVHMAEGVRVHMIWPAPLVERVRAEAGKRGMTAWVIKVVEAAIEGLDDLSSSPQFSKPSSPPEPKLSHPPLPTTKVPLRGTPTANHEFRNNPKKVNRCLDCNKKAEAH